MLIIAIFCSTTDEDVFQTCGHSGSSQQLRDLLGDFMKWLQEGIATLSYRFSRSLLPGSKVITDDWDANENLEQHLPNHVAQHRVVVHADNFVDPATGVHTQEAESAWANLKAPIKARRGISRDDVQTYLDDRMWRQWRGLDNIIGNFLPVLDSQYRDYVI